MKTKSLFSFKQPEDSPGFLLWKTTVTWQRLIKKALEPYNIAHAQFVIMAVSLWLQENRLDTTQVTIAAKSGLDKMTVSKSLKKLAQLKLVKRVENTQDTRAKNVTLTPKGKKLIAQLVPIVEQIDHTFFKVIDLNKQKPLMKALRTLGTTE